MVLHLHSKQTAASIGAGAWGQGDTREGKPSPHPIILSGEDVFWGVLQSTYIQFI